MEPRRKAAPRWSVAMARASMFASMSLVLLAMTAKAIDLEPEPDTPDLPVVVDYPAPSTFYDDYYLGCYLDTWDHILQDMYYAPDTAMTIDLCRSQAQRSGVQFYGLKGGYECFGGNDAARLMSPAGGGCNIPCFGNSSEICGGSETVSVYITPRGPQSPPPPHTTPGCYVGCFADMANNRTLAKLAAESDEMTINSCREAAQTQGYAYFGVEAGRQCFVGNEVAPPRTDAVTCDYRCAGDANQICGGDWAISVYHSYDPNSLASPRPPPPSLRKKDYLGCFADVLWMRALPKQLEVSDNMTIAACRNKAVEAGLTLYGVEAGRECWGGNERFRAVGWGRSPGCTWTCSGDDCEVCGGDLAIDIYTVNPDDDSSTMHPSEMPSMPENAPPHHWDFWPLIPEFTFPRYPEPSDYSDLSPPVYETMPLSPPVYGTTPPSYGAATPPPTAEAFLLPEDLRPESAYFDARSGLSVLSVPGYEDGTVLLWKDVLVSERPDNLHFFTGSCGAVPEDELGGPAIRMDGLSCASVMEGPLPNWDTSYTGAFTAVWIGRFADDNWGKSTQAIMTLSRTPEDFDREFMWTNDYFFTYSYAADYGNGLSDFPAIPAGQWTMQVISRKPSPRWGLTSLSYYLYGQSSGFYKAKSLGSGCELDPDHFALGMDYRDKDKAFKGDLAVVLMYNRTLSEWQIRNLITFYQARFGWGRPRA